MCPQIKMIWLEAYLYSDANKYYFMIIEYKHYIYRPNMILCDKTNVNNWFSYHFVLLKKPT